MKEIFSNSELFGESILDFKYEFININNYNKEELYKNQNMSSAIFLLDQNIYRDEFYDRLIHIVNTFNKLKEEEKLQLKQWLVNVNAEEDDYLENIEKIFNAKSKEEVGEMTSNISKGLERLKKDVKKEGIEQGKSELLIKQLIKKFKELPDDYINKLKSLPEEAIDDIGTEIFDMECLEDLNKYLKNN